MARLTFRGYHNMIAILEKYEHNVDFHPIVVFVEASHIRRNLKLKDEAGISSLPDAELFENLALMRAEQDKANIIKTSTLPYDSPPRVTSLATDEGSIQQQLNELTDLYTRLQRQQAEMASKITAQDLEIASLKARIKLLEDKDRGVAEPSREDATIKGKSLETGEEAAVEKSTKRGSNDTEKLVNVLTSLDAVNILTSGGVQVIARDAEIARIHVEEELQMLIDSLDRNNETIAKYLHEYEQFATDLSIGERIELINDLIEDFVHICSKEEGERVKRKGLRLEQESAKKAFPLPGESSHWQYKFPLPVEGVPTARRMEIPLPGVCTAMMKKLTIKDKWENDNCDSPLLGVNTPRSDEDRLKLMELMVFLLQKDKSDAAEDSTAFEEIGFAGEAAMYQVGKSGAG
nr:hypothetical protein [Tanacetum cinerariifolium]